MYNNVMGERDGGVDKKDRKERKLRNIIYLKTGHRLKQ